MANPPFDTTPQPATGPIQNPLPSAADINTILAGLSRLRAAGWPITKINAYATSKYGANVEELLGRAADARARENGSNQNFFQNAHEDDTAPGPVATAVTHFGNAAAMGWSDKLAGLYAAIDALPTAVNPVDAFKQGAQQQRDFLQAGAEANPGVARASEIAGTAAASIPAFEGATRLATKVMGPGLLSTAVGGGVAGAGLEEAQRTGAGQPFSLANLLKGGGLGLGGNVAGAMLRTAGNPASWRFDRAIEADGGPEALAASRAELQQQGVQPLPAELGPSLRDEALKFIPRASANARAAASRAIDAQLQALETRRLALTNGPTGYDATLAGPANISPRIQLLLTDPDVAPIIESGVKKGRIPEDPSTWSGRDLFWVKKQLDAAARNAYRGADKAAGEVLRGGQQAVDAHLSQTFPGYDALQRQVAQLKARSADLTLLKRTVTGRTGVNMRGTVRPTVGTGPHHQMIEEAGLDLFERNRKAANTMVRTLFDPNLDVEGMMTQINRLRSKLFITPHEGSLFQRVSGMAPAAAAPAAVQTIGGPDVLGLYGFQNPYTQKPQE